MDFFNKIESIGRKSVKKTVFIIALILSFNALAECDEPGYFDCGTTGDVKWYMSTDQKTLTISGNGAMGNYAKINTTDATFDTTTPQNFTTSPWADYTFNVENIVVAEGVTSIGVSAFRNMRNLTNVVLPSSLTSIGDWAFLSDSGLTTFIIPDSVTTIGEMAFYNDKGMESIIIPSSVTSIGSRAFGNNGGTPVDRNIPGIVYCEQPLEGTSPCDADNLGLPQNRFVSYSVDQNGNIIVNGQKYSSLEKLAKGVEVKRIYTVEEAAKLSKPTGNTFKLRYK